MEAIWFINEKLPCLQPDDFVHCFQQAIHKSNLGVFSFISKKDGLLERFHFAILVDPQKCSERKMAFQLREKIINRGGVATVRTVPEIRKDAINVVLGQPKPQWANYLIKLYSIDLVMSALRTGSFNSSEIQRFRCPLQLPARLNISNICKLI